MAAPTIIARGALDITAAGVVGFSKDPDTTRLPASTMKSVTVYAARKWVTDAMLAQSVTITAEDITGGSTAQLKAGDVLTWDELFHGVLLPSGNDAANAVARLVGQMVLTARGGTGTPVDRFLTYMAEVTTADLGWTGAVFDSPAGLGGTNRLSPRQLCQLILRWDSYLVRVGGTVTKTITITGDNARKISLTNTTNPSGPVYFPEFVSAKTGTLGAPYETASLVMLWTDKAGARHALCLMHSWPPGARWTDARAIIDHINGPAGEAPAPAGVRFRLNGRAVDISDPRTARNTVRLDGHNTRLGVIETKNTDQDARLDGRALAAGADFHSVTENGEHKMLSFPTNWQTQNMPVATRGILTVQTFAASRIITYRTFETTPRVFMKSLVSGVWSAWRDTESVAIGLRDGKLLAPGTDFYSVTASGRYHILDYPTAAVNAPVANVRGVLEVAALNAASTARMLTYTTYEAAPRVFVQGIAFSAPMGNWREVGAGTEAPALQATAPADGPGSGLKVVPLNVTIGGASSTDAPTTGTFRYPMRWHAPVLRVRVCLQNVAPITGAVKTGAVNVTGLWVGKHSTRGAFTAAPRQVQGAFSTPADGSVFKSGWFWLDQTPGVEDVLSLGYTASNGTVHSSIANGWKTANPADAGATAPTTTATPTMPFYVWLEAETYATTPVIACFGDSLSSGVSAGGPMFSWLTQYCERVKALPRHHSNSGDTMQSWAADLDSFKWHVFDGLAKPDALIWAMGSNDLFADSISLEQAKSYFTTLFPVMAERVSPNIYLANIMPRTAATGANEDKRRAYNTWLAGLPLGARDLFNFRDAISADDETIRAEYDADGVHLVAAGYGAMAAAITRPVTAPPVMYQTV